MKPSPRIHYPTVKSRVLSLWVGAASFVLSAMVAQAQFFWTGGGTTDDVTEGANWQGGVAPTGSGTENLSFDNSSRYNPTFNSAFAVNDIYFGSTAATYNLTGTGSLIVNGDLTTDFNAAPAFIDSSFTINFAAGNHNISQGTLEVSGGDIYFFGTLTGTGNIAKYGSGRLIVDHFTPNNTFSGTIDLLEGTLLVHNDGVLGTGTLIMDNGTLIAADYYDDTRTTTLANNLILGNYSSFGESGQRGSLTFTGSALTKAGEDHVYISARGNGLLTLNNVCETDAGTQIRLDSDGVVRFTGTSTYTGGTQTSFDAAVIFANGPPVTGTLEAFDDSYIGTEKTTGVQAGFLDHFDLSTTYGIIGFDSPDSSNPQTFSEALDFSNFENAGSVRIGSATAAILTGTITPFNNDRLLFGGRGVITVTSDFSVTGLYASHGIQVFLRGHNTFDFVQTYLGGAIVFDGANALDAGSFLATDPGGYIGQTELSGLSTAAFIGLFDQDNTRGVIGFDAHDPIAGRTVSDAIDLTGFTGDPYIGTSTNVTLTGPITEPYSTYYFTAFRNGQLTVDSVLTGASMTVQIGQSTGYVYHLPPANTTFSPTVTLNGANTYGGGTQWSSGNLVLGHNNALGSGQLYIDTGGYPSTFSTNTAGLDIQNDIYFGSSYQFALAGDYDYTLSGELTGSSFIDKRGINTVTISGSNDALASYITIFSGILEFTSDTAAGRGTLALRYNGGVNDAQAIFTSGNPEIGSLAGDFNTTLNIGSGNLTIYQDDNTTFDGNFAGTGDITVSQGFHYDGQPTLTITSHNPTFSGSFTLQGSRLAITQNDSLGTGMIIFDGGALSLAAGVTISNPISFGGNGGTLNGNGSYSSPVAIGAQTYLSPGNSVGHMTFTGGLTWAPDGNYNVEVQSANGGAGVGYDSIDVTGGLMFTATNSNRFTIHLSSLDAIGNYGNVSDFDSSSGYAWLIAHTDNLTGFDPNNIVIDTGSFSNNLGAGAFNVSAVGNDIFLNFSPVPEPSTYALLGLGVLSWLGLRQRRK